MNIRRILRWIDAGLDLVLIILLLKFGVAFAGPVSLLDGFPALRPLGTSSTGLTPPDFGDAAVFSGGWCPGPPAKSVRARRVRV